MFRVAVLAVVAVYGVNLAYLISGTVLVENVFSLPGLGQLLVNSVSNRDYPVVQGVTLLFALLIVLINLLTDITQAAPRSARRSGDRRMSAMSEVRMSVVPEVRMTTPGRQAPRTPCSGSPSGRPSAARAPAGGG